MSANHTPADPADAIDAGTSTGVAREDVLYAFQTFLGREPESPRVFEEATGIEREAYLANVIGSEEFSTSIRTLLLAGKPVGGPEFSGVLPGKVKAWAATLPLSHSGVEAVGKSWSWPGLRAVLFADPLFRTSLGSAEANLVGLEALPTSGLVTSEEVVNAYRAFLGRDPEPGALDQVFEGGRDMFIAAVLSSEEFDVRVRWPMLARQPANGPLFERPPSAELKTWIGSLDLSSSGRKQVASAETWHVLHTALFADPVFRASVPAVAAKLDELKDTEAPVNRRDGRDDVVNAYRLLLGRDPESDAVVEWVKGVDLVVSLSDKIASEEFDFRVRKPMLARQPVSGPVFNAPPTPALLAWAATLPLSPDAQSSVAMAKSWYQLHVALFADPIFQAKLRPVAHHLAQLAECQPPDPNHRPGRKEIPEPIRLNFPLTERFFDRLIWLDREKPRVSIIILSYCRPDLVENLVKSIWLFTSGYTYEIIVVDNGSPPGEHRLSLVVEERTNVVRLARNQYLGDAYNIGVERAKGVYLVLMNNDIVVEAGWLEPMIGMLENDESIGAVGPKFLYPTGQLQEAGALIDSTGYSVQLGKRGSADAAEFNEIREVHYCTGATIATRRQLYIDLQGYDWRWSPGYYEDVDLCFKMRDRGLKIMYTPKSSVFHIESATMQERPPSANLSIAIDNNRRNFVRKWQVLLGSGEALEETRITKADGLDLKRFHAITDPPRAGRARVAVFFPYELIPGGGEKFALSIMEQIAADADVFLVFESTESLLRIMSVVEDLGFPGLVFHAITLEEAANMPAFDTFFLIGNELFPVRRALGKRNYFICQFPFPVSHEFLSHYYALGYYKDYQSYLVYSIYVKMQVRNMLHDWQIGTAVEVLSPTADMVRTGHDKANEIIGVGRFFTGGHNKRHDVMIDGVGELIRRAPELGAKLHLAGALHNGAEHREHLKTLLDRAKDLPVTFHTDILRSELDSRYRSAKVYWHAAGWDVDLASNPEAVEHFGITILEAMSAGCVPVAYAAGGPAEIVKHGINGFLVAGLDEMTDWTIKILRDWDMRLIQDIRANALETARKYDKTVFRKRMREIGIVDAIAAAPISIRSETV